jgi:RNA polymerase sigma factor (sigma-70 family)
MANQSPEARRVAAVYHFCRVQMPAVAVPPAIAEQHLQRTFELFRSKDATAATWPRYLENLHALDWFLTVACLEGDPKAWESLFAARAYRSDCLLIDALRARAVRLYPRDEERQESAVTEFWSHLLVADAEGGRPVLARYDGLRPLVPWLIRVFQNWHVSQLRHRAGRHSLADDDVVLPLPNEPEANGRWHEAFCSAARESLAGLSENELLILGLRLRYRMSQREVAKILGVHEGTISRQTEKLRDRCLDHISRRLVEQGWTGDGLAEYVRQEMAGVLYDEPRLAAERLAGLLAARGKHLPASLPGTDH